MERKGGRNGVCRPMGDYHFESGTRLYKCWSDMVSRCVKTDSKLYQKYGAKGIGMFKEWSDSYVVFKEWAYSNGYTGDQSIKRRDISCSYTPDNCYFLDGSPRVVVGGSYIRKGYPNRHPLYSTWQGIKTRCYNPNSSHYKWYGANGIVMCDEWSGSFEAFYTWAMSAGWVKGLTIDRINNTLSYNPQNCQFITKSQNSIKRNYDMQFNRDGTIKIV